MKTYPHNLDYSVSKEGRVWSKKTRLYLKPSICGGGYYRVILCRSGKSTSKSIHQMVLETYVRDKEKGQECRHLDGNKLNNSLCNLCWGSSSENSRDTILHARRRDKGSNGCTLSPEKVKEIRGLYEEGLLQTEIGNMFGVTGPTISKIITGKSWLWVGKEKCYG